MSAHFGFCSPRAIGARPATSIVAFIESSEEPLRDAVRPSLSDGDEEGKSHSKTGQEHSHQRVGSSFGLTGIRGGAQRPAVHGEPGLARLEHRQLRP
jgi:hypothetical protein